MSTFNSNSQSSNIQQGEDMKDGASQAADVKAVDLESWAIECMLVADEYEVEYETAREAADNLREEEPVVFNELRARYGWKPAPEASVRVNKDGVVLCDGEM